MLRVILRNVQYYLLFFSSLLVLLAFQRLQFYDQGILPSYAFMDRPHGGGRYTVTSSPDSAGRVYYGGDESREIGLFKFKLGLFKFVLPTFSTDDASWERTNELSSLISVPPPTNKRRKHLRLRAQSSQLYPQKSKEREKNENDALKSSVAYVVVMPQLPPHPSKKLQTSNADDDTDEENVHSYLSRASVLSQSIERAHTNSPYKYQLYALNLNDEPLASTQVDVGDSKQLDEAFLQSGFKIINVNEDELKKANGVKLNSDRKLKDNIDKQQQSLSQLLNQNDVVVQISLNSFLLKPMDDLFDALMKGGNTDSDIGVVHIEKGDTEEGKYEKQAKQADQKLTPSRVDSYALESMDSSSVESELFVFISNSQRATNSYLKSLECISLQSRGETLIQHDSASEHPKLRPLILVSRKNQQVSINQKEDAQAQCRIHIENTIWLDKCLYDVGLFDVGHDCSHASVKDDARVAHFPEGGAGGMSQKNDISKEQRQCAQPWECLSRDDCSKNNGAHDHQICMWLCSEWFDLVDNR